MSDRIDHAAEAVGLLALAVAAQHQGDPRHLIAAAHIHATLAVAEQARIANLIALAGASDSIRARQQAEEVLYQPTPVQAGIDLPLTPDIAAALGIEAVDHD